MSSIIDVNEKYRNNENTDDLVVAVIYNVFGTSQLITLREATDLNRLTIEEI